MTEALPEEKIAECQEVFNLFDVDNEGVITTENLGDAIRILGYSPSQSEIKEIISEFDLNKTNQIKFNEFINIYANKMKLPDTEEALLEAFKIFDSDANENINNEDFKNLITNIGEKLTDDELKEIFNLTESSNDGFINYKKLVKKIMSK